MERRLRPEPHNALQAPGSTVPGTSDRECLESWARHRDADSLQALVERYLVFVHSSALRRTGDAARAAEGTRAVFLVLVRRTRRLRKKTVLAGWLFHVTAVACRKLGQKRTGRLVRLWQWISRKPRPALPPDATLWTRLAPQIDRALERLRTKQRNAVLLGAFLSHDFASAAKVLRTSDRRVEQHVGRGSKATSVPCMSQIAPTKWT
jgi:DNA-directed RNA polymerase specialized sigma24 family protein